MLRQKTRLSRKPDTWQYSWDAEDRLTRVVTPDGTVWRYLYDPLGRRIGKQRLAGNGVDVLEQVDFAWDGTSMCEQTTSWADSVDSVTLTWHLNGAEAVAQSERRTLAKASQEEVDARFFAIVSDLSGAPCELIDESGDIAWRARVTNWASTTTTSGTTTPRSATTSVWTPSAWLRRPTLSVTWTALPPPATPGPRSPEVTDPAQAVRDTRSFPLGTAFQPGRRDEQLHLCGRGLRPVPRR